MGLYIPQLYENEEFLNSKGIDILLADSEIEEKIKANKS